MSDITTPQAKKYASFAEFFPFYLSEHSDHTCWRLQSPHPAASPPTSPHSREVQERTVTSPLWGEVASVSRAGEGPQLGVT